ncbi:hypothetical protein ABPG75_003668 [Micractinium tetrahymenae]
MSKSEKGGLLAEPPTTGAEALEGVQAAVTDPQEGGLEAEEPAARDSGMGSAGEEAGGAGADGTADSQEQEAAAAQGQPAVQDHGSELTEGTSAAVTGTSGETEPQPAAGEEPQTEARGTGSGEELVSAAAADGQEQTGGAGGDEEYAGATAGIEDESGAAEGSSRAAAEEAASEGEQRAHQEQAEEEAEEHAEQAEEEQQFAAAASTAAATASISPSASASPSSRASRRRLMNLTFSGPPKCLERRPRTAVRSNYSHSQQRVRQILAANDALVRRLGEIASQPPEHERSQAKHDRFMAHMAASSTKRRAGEARRIMQQNLRIYQRLQEVQPSRDVARSAHEKDFAKHEKTLAALAELRKKGHGGWVK